MRPSSICPGITWMKKGTRSKSWDQRGVFSMATGLIVSRHSFQFPPLPPHSATCLLDPVGHNRPETATTSRPNPRFLPPFPSLLPALAQKLSPGGAAKKPELAAGPPHIPPQLYNLSPAWRLGLCSLSSLGHWCLCPDGGLTGACLQTLTSCLVWVWSLISCGKEKSEGTIWAQLCSQEGAAPSTWLCLHQVHF